MTEKPKSGNPYSDLFGSHPLPPRRSPNPEDAETDWLGTGSHRHHGEKGPYSPDGMGYVRKKAEEKRKRKQKKNPKIQEDS